MISLIFITIYTDKFHFRDWTLSIELSANCSSNYFKYSELNSIIKYNVSIEHVFIILMKCSLVSSKPVTAPQYVPRFEWSLEWKYRYFICKHHIFLASFNVNVINPASWACISADGVVKTWLKTRKEEEQTNWFNWVSRLCWNRSEWFKLVTFERFTRQTRSKEPFNF